MSVVCIVYVVSVVLMHALSLVYADSLVYRLYLVYIASHASRVSRFGLFLVLSTSLVFLLVM